MNLLIQDLFLQEQVRPSSNRQIKAFSEKLEKIDKRPSDFGNSRGLSNPIFYQNQTRWSLPTHFI